jgi:ParB-like chromosome segregation protein Spo0J
VTVALEPKGLFDDLPVAIGTDTLALIDEAERLLDRLAEIKDRDELIEAVNRIRAAIHAHSPFAAEPVDFVRWVRASDVAANDYNPNSVAPPEMKLLALSVGADGYTQPIVAWPTDTGYEVVDGFHRHRVGRESPEVRRRIDGYLPLTIINPDREDRGDRIAATIRHNRARGKHRVEAMSDIVIELKRRNWSDERIATQLGMDQDEILRLCQITGLADVFSDQDFSRSWDVDGQVEPSDFEELSEQSVDDETGLARTVNTSDPERVFHTFDKWECYKAGFYQPTKEGVSQAQGEEAYREFLADDKRFAKALGKVVKEWEHSCEHYLTNTAMNRIAWLGQAAACYALELPSAYRGGYHLLTPEQQKKADETAFRYLNKWLKAHGRATITLEAAYSYDRQMEIY